MADPLMLRDQNNDLTDPVAAVSATLPFVDRSALAAIGLGIARAQISSLVIPLVAFTVAGFSTVGDGGGGTYVRGTSTGPMAIQDATSTWWNLDLSRPDAEDRWFGVKADGVTDDKAALQLAVDLTRVRNVRLNLSGGTRMLSQRVTLGAGAAWLIGRFGATLKCTASNTDTVKLLSGFQGTGYTIEGIIFDGNVANNTSTSPNVQFFQCSDTSIRRNTFQNTRGITLNLSTSIARMEIAYNKFVNCGAPNGMQGANRTQAIACTELTLGNSYAFSIHHNRFESIGLDVCSMNGVVDSEFSYNKVLLTAGGGFYCAGPCARWTISHNIITAGLGTSPVYPAGIDLPNLSDSTVSHNICYGCGGPGIGIFGGSNDIAIHDNLCFNNQQQATVFKAGIIVSSGSSTKPDRITLSGNKCYDDQSTKTQSYGLIIDPACTNLIVDDTNQFVGNAISEIGLVDYAVDQSLVLGTYRLATFVSSWRAPTSPAAPGSLSANTNDNREALKVYEGASWVSVRPREHPGYVSGNWYTPPGAYRSGAPAASAADTLYAYPLIVHEPVTVASLGVRIATAVTGSAALVGIYSTVNGRPAARLGLVSSPLAGDTVATVSSAVAAPFALMPGTYWIAVLVGGAFAAQTVGNTSSFEMSAMIGSGQATNVLNGDVTAMSVAMPYSGGLPASLAAAVFTGLTTSAAPRVAFQVA